MRQGGGDGFDPGGVLPYAQWLEDAWRDVALAALSHAAEHGLPGGHHFYITFSTRAPHVGLPEFLRARHPDTMTIVLQHQLTDLKVRRGAAPGFSVGLSFSGRPCALDIPLNAVLAFMDPEARLELRFMPPPAPVPQAPAPEGTISFPGARKDHAAPAAPSAPSGATPKPEDAARVVSIDGFRAKKSGQRPPDPTDEK